jgi:hypothetical protein
MPGIVAATLAVLLAGCEADRPQAAAVVAPAASGAAPATGTVAPAPAAAAPAAAEAQQTVREPTSGPAPGQATGPVRLEEINPSASGTQARPDATRGGGRPGGMNIEAPSPWGVMPGGARRP